ncbi:transposable element Tcb2 transposase [Trichonephila clavipes]|nr:transposable element Tcb2 transposase [Trichonephila clavipes]
MQRDCALRIAGRGRLTSFSVEYKTADCFIGRYPGTGSIFIRKPVSSRTLRRCLAERHMGSRCPLLVPPLTPTHRRLRLEWCSERGNWTAAEWNQVVFSNESRFNLSSDDNRFRVWRPTSGEASILLLFYSDTTLPQLV